jgi:hypothetical protein
MAQAHSPPLKKFLNGEPFARHQRMWSGISTDSPHVTNIHPHHPSLSAIPRLVVPDSLFAVPSVLRNENLLYSCHEDNR